MNHAHPSSRFCRRWLLSTLTVLIIVSAGCAGAGSRSPYVGPAPAGTAGSLPEVDSAVDRARRELFAAREALTRGRDEGARAHIEEAERVAADALSRNPHSGPAAVILGLSHFYEGVAGDRSGFERCVDHLEHVVALDPDALQAARYLAHAHARLENVQQSIYYAGYTQSLTSDPEIVREMDEVRRPLQKEFLTSWYEYEDFYESAGARILQLDPQTNRFRTVLRVTPEWERKLAARGLRQFSEELTFSRDEETRAYLQDLVDELTARTPGPGFRYEVRLVDSDEVNAMALPGRILVNTGLLSMVENEAELVAVLSHELAHVYAHHNARQFVSDYKRQMVAGAILEAIEIDGEFYDGLLDLAGGVALELIRRGYSRGQEKEADRYGAHIAFNAGYNPTFMTSFFLKLYEARPDQPWKLLSTHPPTNERIEYTSRYLQAFPLDREMQVDSEEFRDMMARLAHTDDRRGGNLR